MPLNKVMLIGNLGRDPEMRYTANGNAVTSFSLAVGRNYTQDGERREETEWFTINAWNKLAEIASQYLTKGQKVYVEGRVSLHQWDGNDGVKHARLDVVAFDIQFLDRPRGAALPDGMGGDIEPDDLPFT